MSNISPARRVSARLAAIQESATLAVDAKAKALKAAGRPVIGFGAGEPDFPTPGFIVEAAVAAARDPKNHKYTPAKGLPELREAIAARALADSGVTVSPDDILVTNGGKQAVFEAFAAIVDDGDEVLLPTPYWTTYPEAIRLAGGVPVKVFAGAGQDYKVAVDQLEAARTPATKALLLCSPSNPTGSVYSPEEIRSIGQWAAANGLWVVTDEIYEHLVYDGTPMAYLLAEVPELANQAIALARLGLDTELICSIGIDEAGALVRQMLTAHHVDLEHAARVPSQAITVALGFEGDRALTTSGDLKVPALSKLRAAPHALVAELGVLADNADTLSEWRQRGCVDRIGEGGELIDRTWVLSECRWDPTGQWKQSDLDPLKYVDVFSLNEHEAVSYTRKSDAKSAARQLLWQVPSVVVTRGANGVFAVIDDEEISLPAAPARTIDPTSAGHAFSAALVYARVKGLHPRAAISMAMLAAARSTESMGSFLAAPTLQELCEWTKTCDVPEGYDLAFLDLAQASAESASDQEDAGLSDEDPRDGSAFEVATDIA